MSFEWDENKNEANLEKHGIAFEEAVQVFAGPTLEKVDSRVDYGEDRIIAIGFAYGRLLTVVYTQRGNSIRLISARKANRYEREAYKEAFKP